MRSLGRGGVPATLSLVGMAAGLALGGVVAAASPARADTLFQVQTAATALHFTLTQQPASSIVTASLVDDATAYAASAFDGGGGSEAQAASIYPGNLVVQGPALFCSQVFSCPVTPPDYPLLADASFPRRQHAQASGDQQAVGSGPLVVAPARSVATATATANSGQTTSGAASVLAGTPAAVTVGASTAATRVTSSARAVTVHVESTVSDITIGGLLHVASVRASDDVVLRSGAAATDVPHITVSGVTVAGVPASIDEAGVHVAGHDGPRLTQQVAQKGIALRTVGAHRSDRSGLARSDASGLQVDLSVPVSGLPYVPNPLPAPFDQVPGVNANGTYVGHLTLGAVGIVAGANAQPAFSLGGLSPLPPIAGGAGSPGATTGGGTPAAVGAAGVAPAPGQQPQVAAGHSGIVAGFLDAVTTNLADLYAALALGTAVLFIGWRALIAYRRWRPAVGRQG